MFKREVTCADCGFLALAERPEYPYDPPKMIEPASLQDRDPRDWYLTDGIPHLACYRFALAWNDSAMNEDFSLNPNQWAPHEALAGIINRKHDCAYFERFTPGGSFTWHLDTQQRRRERLNEYVWRAVFLILGVAGTVIAGLISGAI